MIKNYQVRDDEYSSGFKNWEDIQKEFQTEMEEPDAVYFAEYNIEDWQGVASVYYRVGNKYYYNSGFHCSCYGLEGQWEPEEYDKQTYLGMLERRGYEQDMEIKKLVEEEQI